MAKPTTGRVEHVPEPDPDQMAADTLMTSVFSGICLIAATVILGLFGGGLGLAAGRATDDPTWAKVGFAVGLVLGMAVIAWALRRNAERIRARSANLYRGAWIGSVAALVIITLMYFLPQVAIPQYCPPGQLCINDQRN
jgi:cbb3-type cytochrome oxidase subunit 1